MEQILVSSCLLGCKVRYNGTDKAVEHELWTQWADEGRLVPLCPEVSGGLSTPRPPAEIVGESALAVLQGEAEIMDITGQNVSAAFKKGAEIALGMAKKYQLRIAILTDGSPSCGSSYIYDGLFAGNKKPGEGLVSAVLRSYGVKVFSDKQIELANEYLKQIESQAL